MLAAQISALDAAEPTMETQYQLRDLLLNIHSCAGKIDSLDIHPEIVRVVEDSPEDALENHHLILAFHMHKLAARLLLRQTCLRCTPADLESRLLCARLLGAIQPVLHTPSEAQILLPLFLAGVDATAVRRAKGTSAADLQVDTPTYGMRECACRVRFVEEGVGIESGGKSLGRLESVGREGEDSSSVEWSLPLTFPSPRPLFRLHSPDNAPKAQIRCIG